MVSAQGWIGSRFRSLALGARAIVALVLVQLAAACGGSGGDPPTQPPPSGTDSVSKVVGPAGGLVVTPGGFAGVDIPAGAFNQNVRVTIARLPDPATPGAGPLPTALKQYPPYYEYQTQPAVPQFGDLVRVGVCQISDPGSPFYPPAATHDRLRLAHPDPANPQSVEILERVGVDDFLRCTGVQVGAGRSGPRNGALGWLAARAARLFPRARPLYAAHGGLGGKVKSFSPFGAVDPGTGATGSEFRLSGTGAGDERFGGTAFDGTNYLVGVHTRGANQSTVEARLVSTAGAVVGPRIVLPGSVAPGDAASIAFDGTNYLMAWRQAGANVLGYFVSKAGAQTGAAFAIPFGAADQGGVTGLAYGGGTYFVAYARETSATGNPRFTIYGRLVSPSGALGAELTLSTGTTGQGLKSVAFDGTRFLTVYTDGMSVRGRFVNTSGAMGNEFTIYAAPGERLEPLVTTAFNGTNYLVTLARKGTGTGSDANAQLVSPVGATIGGLITIAGDPANDEFPISAVGSGSNFLVSYVDNLSVAAEIRVRARFVSGSGALLGSAVTLAVPQSGKAPFGGVFNFDGSRYFMVIQRGVPAASNPSDISLWTQNEMYGAFPTIPTPGS